MPTTITSAGIVFNDATSLTSANIGTAQLANNSVTAAKLGTNEQRQISKCWVNFNGANIGGGNAPAGSSLVVTAGSNTGTFTFSSGGLTSAIIGVIYSFNIGGTAAPLGGVDVTNAGVRITSIISATQATFVMLGGSATSSQTVNGNNAPSGFSYGTYGIRSSFNVSSITKNGTGDYTVNLVAGAVADANYSVTGSSINIVLDDGGSISAAKTISALRFSTATSTGSRIDSSVVSIAIFGN